MSEYGDRGDIGGQHIYFFSDIGGQHIYFFSVNLAGMIVPNYFIRSAHSVALVIDYLRFAIDYCPCFRREDNIISLRSRCPLWPKTVQTVAKFSLFSVAKGDFS